MFEEPRDRPATPILGHLGEVDAKRDRTSVLAHEVPGEAEAVAVGLGPAGRDKPVPGILLLDGGDMFSIAV